MLFHQGELGETESRLELYNGRDNELIAPGGYDQLIHLFAPSSPSG